MAAVLKRLTLKILEKLTFSQILFGKVKKIKILNLTLLKKMDIGSTSLEIYKNLTNHSP